MSKFIWDGRNWTEIIEEEPPPPANVKTHFAGKYADYIPNSTQYHAEEETSSRIPGHGGGEGPGEGGHGGEGPGGGGHGGGGFPGGSEGHGGGGHGGGGFPGGGEGHGGGGHGGGGFPGGGEGHDGGGHHGGDGGHGPGYPGGIPVPIAPLPIPVEPGDGEGHDGGEHHGGGGGHGPGYPGGAPVPIVPLPIPVAPGGGTPTPLPGSVEEWAHTQHHYAMNQPCGGANPPGSPGLVDPRTIYPTHPFAPQTQPWPGLNSKMVLIPDCGESTYKGCNKLPGRKVLITGGDSGIGRACAIAMAREGADVAISYLPQEESDAEEVRALIEAAGRVAVLLPGDIQDEDWCKEMVRQAYTQLGGLDTYINNASFQKSNESILTIRDEDFDQTLKTNIYAPFWILQEVIPLLPVGGSIIITTSHQAVEPYPNVMDYALTKAGLWNMAKSLSKFLMTKGVRVNAVAPAPVWTPLQISGGQPEGYYVNLGNENIMDRPAQPAELAPAYVFLASYGATAITGQVIPVTNGDRFL